MTHKEKTLQRLNAIAESVKQTGQASALLGLGSIGKDLDRMDDYSDLDFFLIAKSGKKQTFIDQLEWLTDVAPPAFFFRNSPDGYKFLYQDGVYCEFAVFEAHELANIPFSQGRIIWKEHDFDENICLPAQKRSPWKPDNLDWAMGEVLTCLYVGLCRYARGEKLSGTRFVQTFALDILVASASFFETEQEGFKDDFQNDRRFEVRFPQMAKELAWMMQGYQKVPQSALALLGFVESRYSVNAALKKIIVDLAESLIKKQAQTEPPASL